MVGPGDERARIEGRSYVRASHADRERVIEELKAAFIQGRLEKDELDLRVDKVFASRTYADLNTLTADLPVRPAAPQPPAPAPVLDSSPAREPGAGKAVKAWAFAAITLPGMVAGVALIGPGTAISLNLISVLMFVCVVTGPVVGLVLLHSWIENHTDGKSSPGAPAGPGGKPAREIPQIMPGLHI